jgi:hypothetical protein
LAGSLSESGNLGYVCDYPIYGQIAGINAFALGAQMANPRAKVYLEWSAICGAKEAARKLAEKRIHYISSQDTARFREDDRESFGLSYVRDDERELLANPVWKWGVYYEEILRRVFNKTMQAEYEKSNKALNYYWGMSAGVVDIGYSLALSRSSKKFAEFLKDSISHNVCTPFLTPIYAQNGDVIGKDEKSLSLDQIINMDYLVENVIGSIPQYEELSPMGKATVDTAGVEKAQSTAVAAEDEVEAEKADDIGIENAKPEDIRAAIEKALELHGSAESSRKSPAAEGEAAVTMKDLAELGLAGADGAAELRNAVCRELGIGFCNAGMLLKRLKGFRIGYDVLDSTVRKIKQDDASAEHPDVRQ